MSDMTVAFSKRFEDRSCRGVITVDLDFEVLVDLIKAVDHGRSNAGFAKMILDKVKLQMGTGTD